MLENPYFLGLSVVVALIFIMVLVLIALTRRLNAKYKLLQTSASSNEMLINQLQGLFLELETSLKTNLSDHQEKTVELEQVSKQLEHRIKNLQEQLNTFEKLQKQQPEDKLYSRAFKLVELGAPIEEIIQECEIPRAEAEILLSIHQKRQS